MANKHVGTNHSTPMRIFKTQLRPSTVDLRGTGVSLPFDCRRTCSSPAVLAPRSCRNVRAMGAAAAINPDGESVSSAEESVEETATEVAPSAAEPATPAPKKTSSLGKRAIFGTILGLSGAVVILFGGPLYAGVTCLVAYQCSKEFTSLVNAKGISAGMKPPPPVITTAIGLLCVLLNAWAYIAGGRTASAMAVSTFILLSLQLVASKKPRFSQLTSAVFGLLYCGEDYYTI